MIQTLNKKDWLKLCHQGKILDVRTKEEFMQGHVKNAINIDFYNESFVNELNKLDKNDEYFVYCKSGFRSLKTLELMQKMNFKKVNNLEKGYLSIKLS